jgi:enediyne biosynthesis protein E3
MTPSPLYRLRGRLLTPSRREVDLDVRGFRPRDDSTRPTLERAGHSFLDGYEIAATSATNKELVARLELVDSERRGFAYEGAGMALAILDGIPLFHNHHLADLLESEGSQHVYMIYVGAGWALARLPRARWAAATRALTDPVLRWLALDGYGFHQAYFKTAEYVIGTRNEVAFPWPREDSTGYAHQAIDQGIGRALWFVEGADPDRIASRINTFAESRRPDLYAGLGLAATYARGADAPLLRHLVHLAGPHAPWLAQGSVFAAEARRRAGNIVTETEIATQVLTGKSVEDAADAATDTWPTGERAGQLPLYEVWRLSILERIGLTRDIV